MTGRLTTALTRPDSRGRASHTLRTGVQRAHPRLLPVPFQKAPFPWTTAVALGSSALWPEPEAAQPRPPQEA